MKQGTQGSADLDNFYIPYLYPETFLPFRFTAADQSPLKYKEKEPYRYKVEGNSFLHMPSSVRGDSTQLSYVAAVDLVAESKCSFALRISNIDIIGPGGSVSIAKFNT